jgi:hypothetical protein
MICWNINVNGNPYSRVYTDRKATPEQALAKWEYETAFSMGDQCLSAIKSRGELTATKYTHTFMDYYGTSRGG